MHRLNPFAAAVRLSLFLVLAVVGAVMVESSSSGGEDLAEGFEHPPKDARPDAYWLWLNGYVNRDYVETELRAYRDAGVAGLCIFDMGARGDQAASPPEGPAFLSDHSLDDIAYAVKVAKELDLDVQLSVASSWDMGGSWVEPRHASMALYSSTLKVDGPGAFDETLPFPEISPKAPRLEDGRPAYARDIAVLALPAARRLPGHDFVFRLDSPDGAPLDYAVLYNTLSDDPKRYGEKHLFVREFSIAVSTAASPDDDSFQEILRGELRPTVDAQRFELPAVQATYARLRLLGGHNTAFDRLQLGEFELYDKDGANVAGSHVADRTRDGAELIGCCSALGMDKTWTADNIHDGAKGGAGGSWSSAGPPPLWIGDPAAVVDLTDRVDGDGRLRWDVPPGEWEIVRFVCANTGERLKVPSPASDGLATDHFSREATDAFLKYEIDRLQSKLGPLGDTALEHLYLASYEVRGRIWTPDFLDQFESYRGYDMTPYLPTLLGHVVGDREITGRFLYDYRKALGELLVDAYYKAAVDAAHEAGIGIESEAGGPGPPIHQVPVDALKAQGTIDEIRGEFWPHRPDADQLWVVKETACAGHIYGKRRIRMEAFTSMYHWQDGPFELKPSADRAFCEGANQMVWHTGAHIPPEAGEPGWVYGAGTHLNPRLAWWSMARPFLDYLARCSYMLQRGHFVADVCYYYGDQGYNFVPPKHTNALFGTGHDYDVTNRDVLLHRMSVREGRVVLPDGMSYALLVLPEREDIDLDVLKKLEQMIRDGAVVVGPKPTRSNGLSGYPQRNDAVRAIADRVWGACDGKTVFENRYGEGRVVAGRTPLQVLQAMDTRPDFAYEPLGETDVELDYIHRRTDDAEIYFVRNMRDEAALARIELRGHGRCVELWNAVTGERSPMPGAASIKGLTRGVLALPPHGSTFVVLHDGEAAPTTALERSRLTEVDGPWNVSFQEHRGAPDAIAMQTLQPLDQQADDGVRHFSGVATYRATFDVSEQQLAEDHRIEIDLGDLWAVGEVFVNGRSRGVVWCPPYVVDATDAIKPGENVLEVKVANTWSNRLVGDASLPQDERITRTNITRMNGQAWKDVPLQRSGLFGPVRIWSYRPRPSKDDE